MKNTLTEKSFALCFSLFVLLSVIPGRVIGGDIETSGLQKAWWIGGISDVRLSGLILNTQADFSYGIPGQIPRPASGGSGRSAAPFLKSLLIPGWGQYSQGRKGSALLVFGLEAAFWGGMFAFDAYGDWLANDYKAYAVMHAGIDPAGKNHDFYVDIGNYSSQDEYNDIQQIERDYGALYLGEAYYWNWDSSANRTFFEDLRIRSDMYRNSVVYFVGAILVNHLASAIEAARYKKSSEKVRAGITFNRNGNGMLTIIKGF